MQTMISRRSPTSLEQYVYTGDGTRVQVDFLKVVRLQLIGAYHTLFYTINHLLIICFYGVFNSSNA